MYFVSNLFADFLKECKESPFEFVYPKYKKRDDDLDEFLGFLSENELIFWTDDNSLFPEVNVEFDIPSHINNAIIDCDENSNHNFKRILSELDSVGCRDIQVRCYNEYSLSYFEKILQESTARFNIKSVELIVKYNELISVSEWEKLTYDFINIKNIIVHSAPEYNCHKVYSHELRGSMGNVIYTKEIIKSSDHCGKISTSYFVVNNISAYMEANLYNSCLYKKVGIDTNGDIKNCPSLQKSYGNINSDNLSDIIFKDDFLHLGKIGKDQIKVCGDCEFRYVCSDCRAFVNGELEKPKKCNYDPYEMQWL